MSINDWPYDENDEEAYLDSEIADQRNDEEAYLYFTIMEFEGMMKQYGANMVAKLLSIQSAKMLLEELKKLEET